MNLLGIDVGTTSLKAVLFDEKGANLAGVNLDYTLDTRGDFVEFDAKEYLSIVRRAVEEIGAKFPIDAVSVDTQGETMILTDEAGEPVMPAIVWLDNRAVKEADEIRAHFGQETIYAVTGQPETTGGWPGCKLLWVRRNLPDVWQKVRRVFLLEDWILWSLSGEFVTEPTIQSSSIYFDITRRAWWDEMLDYIGVPKEYLPRVLPSGAAVGKTEKGAVVVTGALDQIAVFAILQIAHAAPLHVICKEVPQRIEPALRIADVLFGVLDITRFKTAEVLHMMCMSQFGIAFISDRVEFIQVLFHARHGIQLRHEFAVPLLKREEVRGISVKFPAATNDFPVEFRECGHVEALQQRHLICALACVLLNFILAEHVQGEHRWFKHHSARIAVAKENLRRFPRFAADDVCYLVRRFDGDFNAAAAEVAFDDCLKLLLCARVQRLDVHSIPEEFENGRLSGSAGTDDAVQFLREVKIEPVEESPGDVKVFEFVLMCHVLCLSFRFGRIAAVCRGLANCLCCHVWSP